MDHKAIVTSMVESGCIYLNHVHKEFVDFMKEKKDLNEQDRETAARYQFQVASLLDILHKAQSAAYDLFPSNKENLDNILKLHHNYQKAHILQPCDCDLCKDVQIPEKKEEDQQKKEESDKATEKQ